MVAARPPAAGQVAAVDGVVAAAPVALADVDVAAQVAALDEAVRAAALGAAARAVVLGAAVLAAAVAAPVVDGEVRAAVAIVAAVAVAARDETAMTSSRTSSRSIAWRKW